MAATLKKLDWKTIIHKLVVQKNRIEAHLDKGGRLSELKDVKFITPYPCQITIRHDGEDYEFTTADGIDFIVYFTNETDFFEGAGFNDAVVTIGFRPSQGRITRPGFRVPTTADPQLFATIAWVIEQYLTQYPHCLVVWVCSTADHQEAARHALFDRKWRLLRRTAALPLRKVNLELAPREYMSLLYRTDSAFQAELEALLPEA